MARKRARSHRTQRTTVSISANSPGRRIRSRSPLHGARVLTTRLRPTLITPRKAQCPRKYGWLPRPAACRIRSARETPLVQRRLLRPAHPFFLATLIVPQSRSLPKAASHCHGFSKSWAEERYQARRSVKSWRCSPGSYLANESEVAGGRMRTLVVGIGALGGLIATRLRAAGSPVWLATRNADL